MSSIATCPRCGREPQIEQVEPWPKGIGPAPWYAGCYAGGSKEHFVGVNGDTKQLAIVAWNQLCSNFMNGGNTDSYVSVEHKLIPIERKRLGRKR